MPPRSMRATRVVYFSSLAPPPSNSTQPLLHADQGVSKNKQSNPASCASPSLLAALSLLACLLVFLFCLSVCVLVCLFVCVPILPNFLCKHFLIQKTYSTHALTCSVHHQLDQSSGYQYLYMRHGITVPPGHHYC